MRSLVVLFAVVSLACGSLIPAQPPHHPALVLDPHGRPLDTAEVINARALHLQAKHLEGHYAPLAVAHAPLAYAHAPHAYAHAAHVVAPHVSYVGGSAVSHQSRVDVHSGPAVVAHAAVAPVLAHSTLGHGHWLHKRSLGHYAYAAPLIAAPHTTYIGGSAVSHQSRVDVHSSPAIVSHAVAAPVVAHHVAAPVVAHVAPAAVSHQSRVDVHSSPAVVAHSVVAAPVVSAHSWASPLHSAWSGLGHLLKKRSLAVSYALPVATSHQSRVDVISSHAPVIAHAAPIAVAHAAPIAVAHSAPVVVAHAAPAVSHQSRVDYITSPAHIAPLSHSAVWTAPPTHLAHSPLALAAHHW